MPKAKQKSQRQPSGSGRGDESDEEYPGPSQAFTQTQTMTQAEKAMAAISVDEIESKVNDLVQYLLIMAQKQLPIKRQDISKTVLKEQSRAFPVMIKKAEEILRTVFGIDLVELEGKQKSYILKNRLHIDHEKPHLEWPAEDNAKMGLVMVILSIIFMKGNVVQDSVLYHALKKLGVDVDRPHEVFGDVKKLVTMEFVRQGYLECIRQPTDPPTFEFKWGQRAKQETSKRHVLEFVSMIYDVPPQRWTSQYQDMLNDEGPPPNEAGPSA